MNKIIKEEEKKELNIKKLNDIFSTSGKILKIMYIFLILIAIYTITLITKEWSVFGFIFKIFKILSPLFLGLVIAWLLEPIVSFLQKKKINRILGTSIVYIAFLGLLYLFFNTIIPILFSQTNDFIKTLPNVVDELTIWFNNLFSGLGTNDFINFDKIRSETIITIETFVKNLTNDLPNTLVSILSKLFSTLGTMVLGLMIGFYLLFDFDSAKKIAYSLVPKKYKKDLKEVLENINKSLFGFIKGTFITSTLIFIVTAILFYIAGLKAPLLFALICAITNIIPYIGPYIGAIPAIIVGFTQSIAIGLIVTVMIIIVQLVEGEFIHPLVMSKTMKLHPVTILISLLIFQHFFGIIGMILAAPIVAIIKVVLIFFNKKFNILKFQTE